MYIYIYIYIYHFAVLPVVESPDYAVVVVLAVVRREHPLLKPRGRYSLSCLLICCRYMLLVSMIVFDYLLF